MKRNNSKFPFDPARTPFFYGWLILAAGVAGILMSLPGQTMGVSVFTDDLIRVLKLSRVDISLAYLIGTITSALLLTHAGRIYDRFGVRSVGSVVVLLFGMVLLFMSVIDRTVSLLWKLLSGAEFAASFILISLAFFLLRFLGQGILTLVSRNMVMKWFEKRRGMANAVLGVFTSFGFSLAPRLFNGMISSGGWNGAWRLMGIFIIIAGGIIFLVFSRDNPADCGLRPDGNLNKPAKTGVRASQPEKSFRLAEARKTLPFWVFGLSLGMHTLFVTAFTFHVVSIFESGGLSRIQAVGIFLPASIISVVVNFAASWVSDYIRLRYMAIIHTAGLIVTMLFMTKINSMYGLVIFTTGYGIINGIFNVSNSIIWPRYYGTKHLGEITGMIMGFMVGGSALGPYMFSLLNRYTGTYASAAFICAGITVVLLILSFSVRRPKHPDTSVIET